MTTTIFGRKKGVNSIVMDGVEDETLGFPEVVTVKKDVGHCPG
jgi:hypothetical protein